MDNLAHRVRRYEQIQANHLGSPGLFLVSPAGIEPTTML